jgi:hypothetical protein
MRGWLVVMVFACGTRMASARDWKDGCPPYVHALDPEHAPKAADFGAAADVDAALGPSRIVLTERWAGISGHRVDSTLLTGRGVLAFNFRGPSVMLVYGYGDRRGEGATAATLMTYVGYRYTGFLLGDAVRSGASLRIGVGASPSIEVDADGTSRQGTRSEDLARASPFESEAFAFDRPVVVSFESRLEVVGCYAPFAALRLDLTEWREGFGLPRDRNPPLWAFPVRLAVGGFVTRPGGFPPQLSVVVEAGFELRSRELGPQRNARLRVLTELPVSKVRFGLYASGYAGDAKGVEVGATIGVDLDGASVLQ